MALLYTGAYRRLLQVAFHATISSLHPRKMPRRARHDACLPQDATPCSQPSFFIFLFILLFINFKFINLIIYLPFTNLFTVDLFFRIYLCCRYHLRPRRFSNSGKGQGNDAERCQAAKGTPAFFSVFHQTDYHAARHAAGLFHCRRRARAAACAALLSKVLSVFQGMPPAPRPVFFTTNYARKRWR